MSTVLRFPGRASQYQRINCKGLESHASTFISQPPHPSHIPLSLTQLPARHPASPTLTWFALTSCDHHSRSRRDSARQEGIFVFALCSFGFMEDLFFLPLQNTRLENCVKENGFHSVFRFQVFGVIFQCSRSYVFSKYLFTPLCV